MEGLSKITQKLKRKVAQVQESEILKKSSGNTFYPPGVSFSQFSEAMKYKRVLLEEFKGVKLDQVFDGQELETELGPVYLITHQVSFDIHNTDMWKNWRERLLANLRLIYGIGPKIEARLKSEGFKTIEDLADHPRYKKEAQSFLQLVNQERLKSIQDWLRYWLPVSHPAALCLTGIADPEDLLFFDLESMGLFSRPLVLLGLGKSSGENLFIKQYLIRDITEELAAIRKALEHFDHNRVLVTYNGRRFDCNYIRERLGYYGQPTTIELAHMDLLFHSRHTWGEKLPDCRLETVEKKVLGTKRPLNIPSALVPDFYNTYLEEDSIGPLIPIIEHNKQDVISLAHLLAKLCQIWS